MRLLILGGLVVAGLAAQGAKPAHAIGCVSGAIVGGAAGHMVHHGVLGAMAGCAAGHHAAVVRNRQRAEGPSVPPQQYQQEERRQMPTNFGRTDDPRYQ
jgi:hypothetical protein